MVDENQPVGGVEDQIGTALDQPNPGVAPGAARYSPVQRRVQTDTDGSAVPGPTRGGRSAGDAHRLPPVFSAAGLFVTGPQVMALYLMEQTDQPQDVDPIPRYRTEGQLIADELIERCHRERRSSLYLYIDIDDTDSEGALDAAVPKGRAPSALVVRRSAGPVKGSLIDVTSPSGIDWSAGRLGEMSSRG